MSPRVAPTPRKLSSPALLLLVALNTVVTVGLAGDILRHVQNQSINGKDFLSSWHLVLYGGVTSVGAWLGVAALRHGPRVLTSELRFGTIGFAILCAGGPADAAWHWRYGAERSVDALVSPPHLLVFLGLSFLLLTPLTAVWARPERRLGIADSACVVVSVVSALLVAMLFTGFLSPLTGGVDLGSGYLDQQIGTSIADFDVVRALGIVLWATVLLVVPWSLVLQRFRLAPGALFVGGAAIGVPPVVMNGWSANGGRSLFFGFLAFGLALEAAGLAFRRGRPSLGARAVAGALAPALLWAVDLLVLRQADLLAFPPALWGGTIMLAAIWGAISATLATSLRLQAASG